MAVYDMRECTIHGLTKFKRTCERRSAKTRVFRCIKCNSEAIRRRYQEMRKKLIAHFGGKCIICGFNNIHALCFHHRDPKEKKFHVLATAKRFDRTLKEAEKCDLMCQNCHWILHAKLRTEGYDERI